MNSDTPRGRLAPSPTGALHIGNARTFLLGWLSIRSRGGTMFMRIEDLDHPKVKPGATQAILDDLRWLGLDWDGEPVIQSERKSLYKDALERLPKYPCVCSRKDIESVQSAPHAGEMLHYSGTCRGRFGTWDDAFAFLNPSEELDDPKRQLLIPCWRFKAPANTITTVNDSFSGVHEFNVAEQFGDFAIARDRDGAAYPVAVVTDDAVMGITEVVRADDLLAATPCQLLVYEALGYTPPQFYHVPLVTGTDGRRLAKRHGDTRISAFREAGVKAEQLVGWLAASAGLIPTPRPISPKELLPLFDWRKVNREPVIWRGTLD